MSNSNDINVYKTDNCIFLTAYLGLEAGAFEKISQKTLESWTVKVGDAVNSLIEEGWNPINSGFGGGGSGQYTSRMGLVYTMVFTKK